jgi:hypothetical protein
MQTPPPFSPPAPRKSNNALIIGIILGGLGLCCAGAIGLLGYAGFTGYQQISPMVECAIGFEGVRDAIVMYAKENNGILPKAENWEASVRPYYLKAVEQSKEKHGPFKPMSADGPWGCRLANNSMSGMAYNRDVAGKKLSELPDSTILVFEVPSAGRDLAIPYARQDAQSSPTIFGERRGWIRAAISGDIDVNPPEGTKVEVRVD